MSKNYFSDYPAKMNHLKKHTHLPKMIMQYEEVLGEKGSYKTENEAMEMMEGVLSEIGKVSAEMFRPAAAEVDAQGAHLKDGKVTFPEKLEANMKKCAEIGVYASPVYKKYGGLGLPHVIQMLSLEMFGQACPNTGLTVANYSMGSFVQEVASEEQKQWMLPKLITGEWRTSMSLTEPNAGSDLGKLRTHAKKNGDHWVINGVKHFISGGQGDISFVLARTDPNSQGLRGLSVFIVPIEVDGVKNFTVSKIEEKVCLHASATCEILFENSKGHLLGEEGNGFRVMSVLMNEARLAMAALATGIATAAWEEAKNYAKTRVTMGKPIIQHPMVADMLFEMEIEIQAMRSMFLEAACASDFMSIAKAQGNEKEYKRWKKRYRRLTPLCKYYACEKAITIAKNALQIFGGYGVCKEYPVERLLRETIIYPIYEGTSQIQSLMVLKDTLKDVATHAGGFLGSLTGAWAESMVTRDPVKAKLLQARNELNQGIKTLMMGIIKDKFKADIEALKQQKIQDFLKEFSLNLLTEKTDLTFPFLLAEKLTRITCDYYAIKCMADHRTSDDPAFDEWILEFAEIAIPRMKLENHYMVHRQPSTINYLRKLGAEV